MTTRTANTHDALMLSEIRSQIGLFLLGSNSDLKSCMLVCKGWRADFRRLLYLSPVLTKPTRRPIILPSSWRTFGTYTQSLEIEEPTMIHRGNQSPAKSYGRMRGGSGSNTGKDTSMKSQDYNLDPALHCPNLQHLTVKLNPKLLPLCCWTRQDEWVQVGEDGAIVEDDQQRQEAMFNTSAVVRYDRDQDSFLVKTSNRILALLHYHPQLQTFRWIGASDTHMDQLVRYLLSRQHQLVELQLEQMRVSVAELNRLIANCPNLQRLHLTTLFLGTEPSWSGSSSSTEGNRTTLATNFAAFFSVSIRTASAASLFLVPPQSQENQLLILDLRHIRSLTFKSPHFNLRKLGVYGPVLEQLSLSDCQFPPDFYSTVELNDGHPVDPPGTPAPPKFGVYWNCPQLKTYNHEARKHLPPHFLNIILETSRGSLRSLSLVSSIAEPDFADNLIARDICRTLTYLDLHGSYWIKSHNIHRLLCHSPELIEFRGPLGVLWGEDLFQSTLSWACVKLKRLEMMFCLARPDSGIWERRGKQDPEYAPLEFPLQRILGPRHEFPGSASRMQLGALSERVESAGTTSGSTVSEIEVPMNGGTQGHRPSEDSEDSIQLHDIQNAFFEQLSRLTQLEILDLTYGGASSILFLVEYPPGIPMTLDGGLDRLKGLSRMRDLDVSGWGDKMTRKEARWLKQYWPELRSIVNKNSGLTRTAVEAQVVGWLAFEICLAQEWPERFSPPLD